MQLANNFVLTGLKPGTAAPGEGAIPTDLLIGGAWREGSSRQRIPVHNPANGEVITTIADATLEDCMAAVDAAESEAVCARGAGVAVV